MLWELDGPSSFSLWNATTASNSTVWIFVIRAIPSFKFYSNPVSSATHFISGTFHPPPSLKRPFQFSFYNFIPIAISCPFSLIFRCTLFSVIVSTAVNFLLISQNFVFLPLFRNTLLALLCIISCLVYFSARDPTLSCTIYFYTCMLGNFAETFLNLLDNVCIT